MNGLLRLLILGSLMTILLIFVLTLAVTAQTAVNCPGANGLTEKEISAILAVHNKARAEVNLPPLKWDCKLAGVAQEWATRGVFEHRSFLNFGESLFVSGDTLVEPESGVQHWLGEKAFWNNSSATCQAGKFCTHYTQVVWKATRSVGCGINRNASGKWKVLFVCNYDPMGNYPGPAY